MQQSKTAFFVIIGLAFLSCIGMALIGLFLIEPIDNIPSLNEEVNITIVVAPAIQSWVNRAAREFSQANPETQIKVITADDLIPISEFRADNTSTSPPAAWLAEATFVVDMARDQGLQFDDVQSVASTSLGWGAFTDNLPQLAGADGIISWQDLHDNVVNGDRLKLIIAQPQNSAEGLAALMSATAASQGTQMLSGSDISAADRWLAELLGNRTAQTPVTPAADFATKGRSAGDLGLLSLASWRQARLDQSGSFEIIAADPDVILDYPFAIWAGNEAASRQAAFAFRDFLMESAQQEQLADLFLNPAAPEPAGVQADSTATQRLMDWSNRQLR